MRRLLIILFSMGVAFSPLHAEGKKNKPAAPTGLHGSRQDAQAARLQWDFNGNHLGYILYAAFDAEHPVFHRENQDLLRQTYVVWDIPRGHGARFIFYVTAIDADGNESAPSNSIHVDVSKP